MNILEKDSWLNRNKHFIFLIVGIFVAVLLWITWIKIGMYWVHSEVQQNLSALGSENKVNPNKLKLDIMSQGSELLSELGQIGDSFGGLNSFLTAIAGALVAWAGYMQHLTLTQARTEAKEERAHRQKLEFESLFFQLLQLSSQATERFHRKNKKDIEYFGARALDSYAHVIYSKFHSGAVKQIKALALSDFVCEFVRSAYDRKPSTFGPYYRLLFQTFKHIADSDLSESEKIRYSNIARGQISEGAVLLLALNGLTREGRKFIPLIERFGLLEHLHRKHQADKQLLLCGYRPRAFMGSQERAKSENQWQECALEMPLSHFEMIDSCRAESDAQDDFISGYDPTTVPEEEG
jgi:hypothetical protein